MHVCYVEVKVTVLAQSVDCMGDQYFLVVSAGQLKNNSEGLDLTTVLLLVWLHACK